jgi:predicted ATP-dependent endonuclease of OLD family
MRFQIENIAKVRSAKVKLNGLTVIAGENGSGKSTVGKMLFSVIQVLKSTQSNNVQKQHNLLQKHIVKLYTRLNNRSLRMSSHWENMPRIYQLRSQLLEGTLSVEQLKKMIETLLADIPNLSPRTKANIETDIKNIALCINNSNNRAAVQAASIQDMIESEFMNKVCSVGQKNAEVALEVSDDDSEVYIRFSISSDKVRRVETNGEEFLEDATYVESPLYLHMLESLNNSIQYVEAESRPYIRGMLPTHIKDFVEKMIFARSSSSLLENYSTILQGIEKRIDGVFHFDKDTNKLYYRSKGNEYSPINTASGTKTFGVLQLLLQSNAIGPNRILLWDEPENHLHPEWQVAFADVILQLVEQGIPIVISTHSPYFIQAVRYFASKYGVENSVDYYFAEAEENGLSTLQEVTNDLNKVFTKLSRPLAEVMNVDKVRKHE